MKFFTAFLVVSSVIFTGNGAQASNIERGPSSISGAAGGEAVAPNFETEVYVESIEADTEATGYSTVIKKGETTVGNYTVKITNTGNVTLVNPTITAL